MTRGRESKDHQLLHVSNALLRCAEAATEELEVEAYARASINRSYYASMHTSRTLISELFAGKYPTGPSAHDVPFKVFHETKDRDFLELADWYGDLKSARYMADYKMDIDVTINQAQVLYDVARGFVDMLSSYGSDHVQRHILSEAARAYLTRLRGK